MPSTLCFIIVSYYCCLSSLLSQMTEFSGLNTNNYYLLSTYAKACAKYFTLSYLTLNKLLRLVEVV